MHSLSLARLLVKLNLSERHIVSYWMKPLIPAPIRTPLTLVGNMALRRAIYVVAAKRTAFGAYGGRLKDWSPTDLQEAACRAALEAGNINKELIDNVVVGNVMTASRDTPYAARHVAVRLGLGLETPCLTVNRLCGSGFQAIASAANEIQLGESEIAMTGGTESMSGAPFSVYGARFGVRLGLDLKLEDSLWAGLTDQQIKMPMGITAERLAEKYEISRQQADEFAIRSQTRWKEANDAGRFKAEIAPITMKSKKGEYVFDTDEHPRPETTMAGISKLPPVFKKDGTVNAANASGVCDGAAAVIIASEEAVKQHNLKPLARIVGYTSVGCDPTIMGIGPVPAIRKLLGKTGHKLEDIDLVEVNEAFAPQYLAVEKELGLDPAKTNTNGGAIALGHPLGASGSRISGHLAHELQRTGKKYALGSACIGGGQGIALLMEKA